MTSIILGQVELSKRRMAIEKLFKPIARSRRVDVSTRPTPSKFVIALGADTFGTQLRKARLPSKVGHLFINYYEIWVSEDGGVSYSLEKAYMHLDQASQDGRKDDEILAIHCDPCTSRSDAQYPFKRGPHMHISSRIGSLNKAHIALCLTNVDNVCSNAQALTDALKEIVAMIDGEFFPHL